MECFILSHSHHPRPIHLCRYVDGDVHIPNLGCCWYLYSFIYICLNIAVHIEFLHTWFLWLPIMSSPCWATKIFILAQERHNYGHMEHVKKGSFKDDQYLNWITYQSITFRETNGTPASICCVSTMQNASIGPRSLGPLTCLKALVHYVH